MISRTKKAARSMAVALAATAAFTITMPTSPAFAIDHVTCRGGENYLKIWSHKDGADKVDCYANRGKTSFGDRWVDKISTGNNDLIYYDANGDSVKIARWHEISFPNRPPKVRAIEIL
ncbi:oxidoreductase [Streptomyces corynorhini]|uniref:Oxidoreductase n=2 Tax=Streptomyces corynorhini TaxID=2282652 RepID=A0A370AWK2_9ACTN|nr:oxidoreductase [Streptomyces corynorhini]